MVSESDARLCDNENAETPRGVEPSHENAETPRGVESSHENAETPRGVEPKRESPKRTTSVSSGLGLLQMVSESNTERCDNEDADPPRGVEPRRESSKRTHLLAVDLGCYKWYQTRQMCKVQMHEAF